MVARGHPQTTPVKAGARLPVRVAIRATGRPVAKEMVRAVLVVATELAVEVLVAVQARLVAAEPRSGAVRSRRCQDKT